MAAFKSLLTDRTWRIIALAALGFSTLALFMTIGSDTTKCAFAAAGTCPAGDTREFARGLLINNDGADSDTLIQGDTNAALFYVDASADRIGIGTSTPSTLMHVAGALRVDGALTLASALPIASGGTASTTAAGARVNLGVTATGADTTYAFRSNDLSDLASTSTARTNLGLGSIATQAASNVAITGGSVTGITDITVADGGTGTSTIHAYSVMIGGTTATGPIQTVSGTGLTAQVLTSNGPGAAPTWQTAASGGYATIQDEATPLTQRTTVNFTGAGVACVDNGGASRTDCTISGSGSGLAADGWVDKTSETWTYASADSPTFTFTISGDVTSTYSPGMRIKLTQTTVKYFIITAVSYSAPNTTVTVYGGTDYTLANAAISGNYYSPTRFPQGFPDDPTKWQVLVTDTSLRQQGSPVANTWYNLGSVSITVPIGAWNVSYTVLAQNDRASGGAVTVMVTLSTANNSQSDASWTTRFYATSLTAQSLLMQRTLPMVLGAKSTRYLNTMTDVPSTSNIYNENQQLTLELRAMSAYY